MSIDYGVLITKLRKHIGITIKEFARKIGVDTSTEFQYENNGRVPEKIINTICNVFNVNKEYFEGKISVDNAILFSGDNHMRVERIKALMNERNISTNKELAELSKVSESRISEILREKYPLSLDKANKIASALCIGVDFILYGDESKKTHPVNDELIEWLWSHPELRKDIWNKIHTNSNN